MIAKTAPSLEDILIEHAYDVLITSRKYKRTKTGFLMHRRDARLILANNIKINRFFYEVIMAVMINRGFAKHSNQGIYLKDRRGEILKT